MPTNYEHVKAWRKKNKDKVNAQSRRYNAKHPDKRREIYLRYKAKNFEQMREKDRDRQMNRRKSDPDGQRVRYLKWRAKKEARLTELAGRPRPPKCEICNGSDGGVVFDHCHDKGHFRGWICDRCNKMLGLVKDNPALLRELAEYLENDDEQTYGIRAEKTTELGVCGAFGEEIPFE